ncbi:MAG TPA: SDR family oxidoreductase [Planctomycetes bacterium]|nr:SDR family oxidoreductase [Planctomycetota bacterium]
MGGGQGGAVRVIIERDLHGRVALVTGGARRLGRELVLALAAAGADVVIHYRFSGHEAVDLADRVRQQGREVWLASADLGSDSGVTELLRALHAGPGRLDILVNNVGNYPLGPLTDADAAQFRSLLETNLIAPDSLIRGSLSLFPERGGHVINLGYAGLESSRVQANAVHYQVTKTGLLLLTRAWAAELAHRGIRVNMISPGQLENSVDLPADPARAIPLGRPGRLGEVAEVLLFLLGEDSYLTGINIDVAGGWRV